MFQRRKKYWFSFLVILFFLPTGCAKDVVTGKSTLNYYSTDNDIKLGKYVMAMQLGELKKSQKEFDSGKNKKQLKMINDIMNKIAKESHYPNFPYEVHLADVPIVNAWCAPGGKMMVYEGLWDPKEGLVSKGNKDEIAAVMAHEMAHANARHITEAISRNMTIYSIGSVAGQVISASSTVGGNIFGEIFSQGFNIFVPTYSRSNEKEADKLGMIYMSKAGYDPRAAVEVWKRASKKRGDQTSIYASHPSSGDRAKYLEQLLPEALKYYEEALLDGKGEPEARKRYKHQIKRHRATKIQ